MPSSRRRASEYQARVFINCPFDAEYRSLFEAIVFAVSDCGYVPRSALEISDAGQVRIMKIIDLIAECQYGIHDLSRTELDEVHGLPRFNMPLEFGIFLGAQHLGTPKQRRKSCLVLDREQYRYQKFCSDIAGQDISAHGQEPEQAVRHVRHWLSTADRETLLPGPRRIWRRYEQFRLELPKQCEVFQQDFEDLTFTNYSVLVERWLELNPW